MGCTFSGGHIFLHCHRKSSTSLHVQLCGLAQLCYYTASSLAVLVAAYLVLFLLASTLIVPGGLFM